MNDYVPLTQVLKDWFETPMAELPGDIQALAEEACFPVPWDKLSSSLRREYAQMFDDEIRQRDASTDRFGVAEPDILGDLYAKKTVLEEDVARWVAIPATHALDLQAKEQRIKELRDDLADIQRQIETLGTGTVGALEVGAGDTATGVEPHKKGSKWTDGELQDLLTATKAGLTPTQLAEIHGVSRQVINAKLTQAGEKFRVSKKADLSIGGQARRLVSFEPQK
jgi:hypothetical protein